MWYNTTMKERMIKEKWQLTYVLDNEVQVNFAVEARGPQDARAKGERIMQKEWGKTLMRWAFVKAVPGGHE